MSSPSITYALPRLLLKAPWLSTTRLVAYVDQSFFAEAQQRFVMITQAQEKADIWTDRRVEKFLSPLSPDTLSRCMKSRLTGESHYDDDAGKAKGRDREIARHRYQRPESLLDRDFKEKKRENPETPGGKSSRVEIGEY